MRPRRLRTRLLLVSVITLVIGIGGLVIVGNVMLAEAVAADNHQRLTARLDAQTAAFSVESGRLRLHDPLNDASYDEYAWVFESGRAVQAPSNIRPSLDRAAQHLATHSRPRTERVGSILLGRRLLRASPHGPVLAVAVAGIDVSQLESLRRDILLACLAVAALIIAAGTASSLKVLSAALAPVEQMTADAEDWQAHDLDRRFALGPARDEITHLAATLDRLLERIASSRRHEQRLAAEVAHELRNPLATITATAELGLDGTPDPLARRRLTTILDSARQMATTIEVILAHARGESAGHHDGADLRAVLGDFHGVELAEPVPPPGTLVEGSDELLHQALAPIVDNARRHARTRAWLEVSNDQDAALLTIAVRDDGTGIDPALGDRIFEPGVSGDGGVGLGLALAQRLIASCGGHLELGDGPGGDLRVTLPRLSRSR